MKGTRRRAQGARYLRFALALKEIVLRKLHQNRLAYLFLDAEPIRDVDSARKRTGVEIPGIHGALRGVKNISRWLEAHASEPVAPLRDVECLGFKKNAG